MRRKLVIAVGVIILLIIILIGLTVLESYNNVYNNVYIPYLPPAPVNHINYINIRIYYTSALSNYLQVTPLQTSFNVPVDSDFYLTLEVQSNAILLTHYITNIYTNTPGFSISNINPSTPISISPGQTLYIQLTVQAQTSNYNGPICIVVCTQ